MEEVYRAVEELHRVVEVVARGLAIWRRESKWICV